MPSRVNDPARDAIIVIMQRLHEEDVSGAILERNEELGYDHLCIPLFADGVDRPATSIGWVDTREEGENVFPQHYTEKFIRKAKAQLGPLQFSGQYQQSPAPAEDGFFRREWFHRYKPDDLPKRLNLYMTSDHAPSGRGDYNVFRIWGVDSQRHIWLIDSFRKKCLMDEAMGIVRDPDGRASVAKQGALALVRKSRPLVWYAENDNTWVAIQSFVRAAMLETGVLAYIKPLPTKGSGDKEGKAQAYQAMAANSVVHLPIGTIGDDALAEYQTFPVGKHDDQVDADGAIARVIAEAPPAFIPAPIESRYRAMNDDYESSRPQSASDSCW